MTSQMPMTHSTVSPNIGSFVGQHIQHRNLTMARCIKNGWFSETDAMLPGQKFSLALFEFSEKSILYNQKSDFQEILVFRSAQYGNILVLDGVLQLTERDEFAYHEMIAHVPMFSHANPKRVLIVGGGDGGILKQICLHKCVESITMVEIDPTVIEVAKTYFSNSTAVSFDDPRLTVVHADALEYMKNTREKFDVIVGDALDPVGPGQTIFQPEFFEAMYRTLCHGGVACVQGDGIWINLDLISDVVACCNDIFDHAEYASITVPSVPCGQTGFILGRKGRHFSCKTPLRPILPKFSSHLKWYNPALHEAAFALPEFVKHHLGVNDDDTDRCVVAGCTLL